MDKSENMHQVNYCWTCQFCPFSPLINLLTKGGVEGNRQITILSIIDTTVRGLNYNGRDKHQSLRQNAE